MAGLEPDLDFQRHYLHHHKRYTSIAPHALPPEKFHSVHEVMPDKSGKRERSPGLEAPLFALQKQEGQLEVAQCSRSHSLWWLPLYDSSPSRITQVEANCEKALCTFNTRKGVYKPSVIERLLLLSPSIHLSSPG